MKKKIIVAIVGCISALAAVFFHTWKISFNKLDDRPFRLIKRKHYSKMDIQ